MSVANWRDYGPIVYPAWHVIQTGYLDWFNMHSATSIQPRVVNAALMYYDNINNNTCTRTHMHVCVCDIHIVQACDIYVMHVYDIYVVQVCDIYVMHVYAC